MVTMTVNRTAYGKYSYSINYGEGEFENMLKEEKKLADFFKEKVIEATEIREELKKKGLYKKKRGRKRIGETQ